MSTLCHAQKKTFYKFYNEDLEHVFEQKDLGVFLDSGLTLGEYL